jgi:hypothetical protein
MKQLSDPPNTKNMYYLFKEVLFGAGLIFDGTLLQVIASFNTFDNFTTIAAIALSISIPSLACVLFIIVQFRTITRPTNTLGTIGLLGTITTIVLIFFHFSVFTGFAFIIVLIISCIIAISASSSFPREKD